MRERGSKDRTPTRFGQPICAWNMAMRRGGLYLVDVISHFRRLVPSQALFCAAFCVLGPGCGFVHAGLFGSADIGTEEFQGIEVLPSARPAGLAGAYTALGEGISAIGYNPAGLVHEDGHSLYSGSLRYQPDGANAGEVAYSRAWGMSSRVALSATYLNFGSGIAGRDENNNPTGELNPSSFYPALTYARAESDKLQWGATLKGAIEDPGSFQGAQTALGVGADAGFQYQPARNLGLGASVVNAGVKLRGHSANEATGSGYLPGQFKVGGYLHPPGLERMTVSLDAELPFYNVPALALGYEYRIIPEWEVRAGTRLDYNDVKNILGWTGATKSIEQNGSAFKASGGTTLRMGNADVEYAVQWWTDLGFVHSITVSWRVD